jgi:hypothetical protein
MDDDCSTGTNRSLEDKPIQHKSRVKSSELNGGKTGWPPQLLQDDCSRLSRWFASRIDARYVFLKGVNDERADI